MSRCLTFSKKVAKALVRIPLFTSYRNLTQTRFKQRVKLAHLSLKFTGRFLSVKARGRGSNDTF